MSSANVNIILNIPDRYSPTLPSTIYIQEFRIRDTLSATQTAIVVQSVSVCQSAALTIELGGLDWDPFRGLAISDWKGPMDPYGKVTIHFGRGVRKHGPLEMF